MKKLFYALYDLANSAYTIIVVTFITSTYFAKQIVGDPQLGAAYWQWTAGLCGILIALSGSLFFISDNISFALTNFFLTSNKSSKL